MNKEKLLKVLKEADNCMEHHPEKDGKDSYYSFTMESISNKSDVHEVLSDIVHNADVHTDDAYKMVACGIESLIEIVNYLDDEITEDDVQDRIHESADSETPIYNYDIMQFVARNPYAVDDAIKEFGKRDSLIEDGQSAYYLAYSNIMHQLLSELGELAESEEE